MPWHMRFIILRWLAFVNIYFYVDFFSATTFLHKIWKKRCHLTQENVIAWYCCWSLHILGKGSTQLSTHWTDFVQ